MEKSSNELLTVDGSESTLWNETNMCANMAVVTVYMKVLTRLGLVVDDQGIDSYRWERVTAHLLAAVCAFESQLHTCT